MNYKVVVAAAALLGFAAPAQASAATAWTYGKYWERESSATYERLDMSIAAQRLAEALAASGYASNVDLNGETSQNAWMRGSESAVFALFGHSNDKLITLDDPPPGQNMYSAGQIMTNAPQLYNQTRPLGFDADRTRSWMEWGPLVDDMRIALLVGCNSAGYAPTGQTGGFFMEGRRLGACPSNRRGVRPVRSNSPL